MKTGEGLHRNIVICCDGTNNQFGSENTNIVRLMQSIERGPTLQISYYDPGVGTLPLPGLLTRATQRLSEIAGLAFAAGFTDKVAMAYRFLMAHYRPGDKIYLFGFSRGAYTVRVLASLLHMYGLLSPSGENLLPYIMRQLSASRSAKLLKQQDEFWALCDEFRETFARPTDHSLHRRFPVHFLGAWDTVATIGWVWNPETFLFSASNPSVLRVRHAIAVDERRAFYRQNRFRLNTPGQDLLELWFPGVHSDVGGGYPADEGGLWRIPFSWMVDEAKAAGLLFDEAALANVLRNAPARPWNERQHRSLTGSWWLAEYMPKLRWNAATRRRQLHLGLGR